MLTFRPALKVALLATFWIIFLLGHFTHAPIAGFSGYLFLGIAALVTLFAAFGWGVWPAHVLLPSTTPREHIVFSLGLGWGMLSLCMMALGVFHAWVPAGALALLIGGSLLGIAYLTGSARRTSAAPMERPKAWRWLIVPALMAGTLLALTPPTYYDSLVYHLALPAAYVRAGHWVGWTDLIYSGFPQNLEMLWTLALLTGVPSLPSMIGWMLALLLLAAIYYWCRRYLNAATGITAVAFLMVMPAFLLLSSGGYVDVGLALYFFLSVYALSFAESHAYRGPFLAAGAFAGLAAGIKYTGALSIGLGALWILYGIRPQRYRGIDRLRSAILFVSVAALVLSPWLIKNTHYFGNPVFPFFYAWGNSALNPWASGAQGYFRALVEYEPHSFLALPQLLWSMAVNGFRFGKGADVLGDFGWALFVAFLPLLIWAKPKGEILGKLAGYMVLFFVCWGMTRPVLRFLMPIAPFFAILAAYGWTQGLESTGIGLRSAAWSVLSLLLLSNLLVFFQITDVFKPFRVPLGLQTQESYLTEKLTYYGAAAFINKNADPNAEIIVVGDQRSYYYERKVSVWTVFNQNPIVSWANTASTPRALHDELRKHGSLLVVNRAEMQRLANYHALDFSETGEKNWEGLLKFMPAVYTDRFCDVYAL